jgi:CRP-like cAMP-binding protein
VIKEVKEAFSRFSFLKLSDMGLLVSVCSLTSVKKGDLLVREGQNSDAIYVILKGVLRTYVIAHDGKEYTTRLAKEKDFAGAALSVLKNEASHEYIEALENARLIRFNLGELNKLSDENIRILRLIHEGTKEAFSQTIERLEFLTMYNPQERYNYIMNNAPDLIKRVPQKYLASYLGITTVSLSRIRNRK